MVHVDTPVDTCRQWNQQRSDGAAHSYSTAVFDDLAGRFERPEFKNRWDSPLFTVQPSGMLQLLIGVPGSASAVLALRYKFKKGIIMLTYGFDAQRGK